MLRRLIRWFCRLLGVWGEGAEEDERESLVERAREEMRQQIARYNQALASHAGFREELAGHIRELALQERELRDVTAGRLRQGNREDAGKSALELAALRSRLADLREQLSETELAYREFVGAREMIVKEAQVRIEILRDELHGLHVQKAAAELAEMARGFLAPKLGSQDTLGGLMDKIRHERAMAAGRARAAMDQVRLIGVEIPETQRRAFQEQALAEFIAEGRDSSASIRTPQSLCE